ncbi:MAG: hypothetical protein ACERKV_03735 [Clostridiaceae bacterium]
MKELMKMLTFEKVLEVFRDYLAEDTDCVVVLTKQGYTVIQWDENSKSWYGVEYCETPEDLQDELLSSYRMNETEKLTKAKRKPTEEETKIIQALCQRLFNK